MRRTARFRAASLAVAALASFTLIAAACGGSDDTSSSGSDGESSSSAPEKLVIAYQAIPNGDLVVKNLGYLEEALPDTEIEWKLFDSGGAVNEAIVAGSVDIGLAGSSPVSRGISNGIEYQVPWIHDVIGEAEALVAKDGIATIADLKGKKVATPFASTAHYSLLAALEAEGLSSADVDIIDAEPDEIYAAWTRGDIDAAYVWNPNLAKLISEGGTVLITSAELAEEGRTTYDLAVVRNDFAEQYPDTVQTWVDQQNKAVELYTSDEDAFTAAIAEELNITPEEAAAQAGDLIFLTAAEQAGADYLGGGLATNLFAAAEFNKELGEIDELAPEQTFIDAVIATFAENAGG
jgi:taurine transport system substrate-binding protein